MVDKKLLEAVKAGLAKQAFVPAPPQGGDQGGMQVDPNTGLPIDPNTGLPIDPNTGMPIDPSMMAGGGAMPPGAMPPGAMPPGADPAAAAADPLAGLGGGGGGDIDPNTGEPYIKLTFKQLFSLIDQILKLATKLGGNGQQQAQQQQSADNGNQELVNEVRNLVTAITAR